MNVLSNWIRVEVLPDSVKKIIITKPVSPYAKVRVLQLSAEYESGIDIPVPKVFTPKPASESAVQVGDILAVTRANIVNLEGHDFITEDDVHFVMDNENMEVE